MIGNISYTLKTDFKKKNNVIGKTGMKEKPRNDFFRKKVEKKLREKIEGKMKKCDNNGVILYIYI